MLNLNASVLSAKLTIGRGMRGYSKQYIRDAIRVVHAGVLPREKDRIFLQPG
jgi:hypothetical protein